MKHWPRRLWECQGIRYLLFGGLTVLVNLTAFALLSQVGVGLDAANIFSIAAALMFAYVMNTWFVFRSKWEGAQKCLGEFLRFLSARLFTMAVEFFGVHFLAAAVGPISAKLLVQILVIIMNYVLSRRLVYR